MTQINLKSMVFGVLGLVWVASIVLIMAPSVGLTTTVYPRPDPDYHLYTMIVSGALLALFSLANGYQLYNTQLE